eukprot:Skav219017  [mRNA]  locus=scaffold2475:45787:47950:+ [translate_table: standard]
MEMCGVILPGSVGLRGQILAVCEQSTPWSPQRKKPSVEAMIFPFSGNHYILMPVYTTTKEAVQKHPNTSVFVNFASFRSVHETTLEAMNYTNLKTIAIIAEAGVPEQQTRDIIKNAEKKGVGEMSLQPKNAWLDNIVMSRLYRPGSVAYVSKSGGMLGAEILEESLRRSK